MNSLITWKHFEGQVSSLVATKSGRFVQSPPIASLLGFFYCYFLFFLPRQMYGTCQELESIKRGRSQSCDVLKDRSDPRGSVDGVEFLACPVNMSVSLGNGPNCTQWLSLTGSVQIDCMCEWLLVYKLCVCVCLRGYNGWMWRVSLEHFEESLDLKGAT